LLRDKHNKDPRNARFPMKYPTLYYKSNINLKYVTSYFLTRMSPRGNESYFLSLRGHSSCYFYRSIVFNEANASLMPAL